MNESIDPCDGRGYFGDDLRHNLCADVNDGSCHWADSTEEAIDAVEDVTARVIQALLKHKLNAHADLVNDVVSALLDAAVYKDFLLGVKVEAMHQRRRWSEEHDAGKEPQDWFWLLGYLAGKALKAVNDDNLDLAKHHTISSAAMLLNWHARLSGVHMDMRPGIEDPEVSKPTQERQR